jgi:hypothetical protein
MQIGTTAQWVAAGLSDARLRTLVKRGALVPVRHGVYITAQIAAAAERNPRLKQALRAAAVMLVTAPQRAVASHETAALIHGLDVLHARVDRVTLTRQPGSNTGRTRQRFRAAELLPAHVTKRYGVPVTTPARTVVDLGRSVPFMDAVVVADCALRLRMTTKDELRAVLDRCAGWAGADRARRVVEFGDGRSESVLESCARVVFDRHGMEPPELQVLLETADGLYRVDFYWRKYLTVAEADGLVKYQNPKKAIDQLKRDQLLRETGRNVVHFTWHELFSSEGVVIGRIENSFNTPPPRRPASLP